MSLIDAVNDYLALLDRGNYSLVEIDAARERLAAEAAGSEPAAPDAEPVADESAAEPEAGDEPEPAPEPAPKKASAKKKTTEGAS